jgi:Rha family phage regulatory protein
MEHQAMSSVAQETKKKPCLRCEKEGRDPMRPVSEFGPNKSARDGLQRYCRPCQRAYEREFKAKRAAQNTQQQQVDNAPLATYTAPEETTSPITAEQAVQVVDGVAMINSRDVAAIFDKQHKNVLRDIEEIVSRTDEEGRLNFEPVEYKDAKGESRPCYLLTRDGFTFTAMGFTGAKADQFKWAIIRRMNELEMQVQQQPMQQQPITPPVVQQINDIHGTVVNLDQRVMNIEQTLEGAERIEVARHYSGGVYIARMAIEELKDPPKMLAPHITYFEHHYNRGYELICIGRFSGPTPYKRIREHHGKLPLGEFSQPVRFFNTDEPGNAETFLRNHAPRGAVKVGGVVKYKDWFFVLPEVLERVIQTWPKHIPYHRLTLACKGWEFNLNAMVEQTTLFSFME